MRVWDWECVSNTQQKGEREGGTYLLGDQLGHLGVAVTERVDGDAGGEIEVLPVLNVPEIGALALDEHGRRAGVGGHHEGGMLADEGAAGRVLCGVRVGDCLRCPHR